MIGPMNTHTDPVGSLLAAWRHRRHRSQLDLATSISMSQRHLSFVETGRARPSRDLLQRLSDELDLPLRDRNAIMVAAGFAPPHPERRMDDRALRPALDAVERVLKGYEPFPALAVDRHWQLQVANGPVQALIADVAPDLLRPPINVLRLSLHPDGLGPRLANFREWRAHVLDRLDRQYQLSGDGALTDLHAELAAMPVPPGAEPWARPASDPLAGLAVPFRLRSSGGVLSFLSFTTVFGTALDVTLSELVIETFVPADAETAAALVAMADGQS